MQGILTECVVVVYQKIMLIRCTVQRHCLVPVHDKHVDGRKSNTCSTIEGWQRRKNSWGQYSDCTGVTGTPTVNIDCTGVTGTPIVKYVEPSQEWLPDCFSLHRSHRNSSKSFTVGCIGSAVTGTAHRVTGWGFCCVDTDIFLSVVLSSFVTFALDLHPM